MCVCVWVCFGVCVWVCFVCVCDLYGDLKAKICGGTLGYCSHFSYAISNIFLLALPFINTLHTQKMTPSPLPNNVSVIPKSIIFNFCQPPNFLVSPYIVCMQKLLLNCVLHNTYMHNINHHKVYTFFFCGSYLLCKICFTNYN